MKKLLFAIVLFAVVLLASCTQERKNPEFLSYGYTTTVKPAQSEMRTLLAGPKEALWVSTYYEGWCGVAIASIPWQTATHWIYFTSSPQSGGSFNEAASAGSDARYREFVTGAHAAGRQAIYGTGGWGSDYTSHMTGTAKTASIAFLVGRVQTYGFDGVDIDWEPVPDTQRSNYVAYMRDLKAALLAIDSTKILTAASFTTDPAQVAAIASIDQLNLMTYDMAGAYPGWVSWPNSAIYTGGFLFPSTGTPPPSIDGWVNWYLEQGVPALKLGFGIKSYGYTWTGTDGLRANVQDAQGNYVVQAQGTVFYKDIVSMFGNTELVVDVPTQTSHWKGVNRFASAESDTSLAMKAQYMQEKGLGGVIVYGVDGAWQPALADPARFLRVVGAKFLGLPMPAPPPPPPPVQKVTKVVYSDALSSPWQNTSWGATLDLAGTDAYAGSRAVRVSYGDWGAADFLNGQWNATTKIMADSLIFYAKATADFSAEIGFYGGTQQVAIIGDGVYHRYSVAVTNQFDRFYIRRNLSGTATVWLDEIAVVSGDTTIVPPPPPPPPPPAAGCDSVRFRAEGFAAGVASVVIPPCNLDSAYQAGVAYGRTIAIHDTLKVPTSDPTRGREYEYFNLYLTEAQVTAGFRDGWLFGNVGTRVTSGTNIGKTLIRGYRPRQ